MPNVHLKYTPIVLLRVEECKADPRAFLSKLVAEFGANRIAWGSNWPNSPGTLKEILDAGKAAIAHLSVADQDAILGGTSLKLYPSLC